MWFREQEKLPSKGSLAETVVSAIRQGLEELQPPPPSDESHLGSPDPYDTTIR